MAKPKEKIRNTGADAIRLIVTENLCSDEISAEFYDRAGNHIGGIGDYTDRTTLSQFIGSAVRHYNKYLKPKTRAAKAGS